MSKRIRLSFSAQEKQSTDWSKCFICQEDKHEALKSPPMKIDLAKSGYRTLSKNIPEFAKINEMPIPLDIRRIAEGDEIKYHESCRLMFNNTKLQRVKKRQSAFRYEPFRCTIVIQIYKKKFDCINRRAIITS